MASSMDKTMRIPMMGSELTLPERQWEKLRAVLRRIDSMEASFYASRLRNAGVVPAGINGIEDFLRRVPFTRKDDLLADRLAHPPFGTNFTEPLHRYTRFCQTTGTVSGQPMAVLDTPDSWEAMLNCWRQVYRAAGLKAGKDRIFFAFGFGPFLGFWTAFEAASTDYLVLPGGGLSSQARLEMMKRYHATVLCCTPTYALRLGENIGVASDVRLDELSVEKIIVAGEPGGSMPTTRERLRALWGNVQIFDHHGMSEVGPVSYEDPEHEGSLCIMEDAYIAEVLDAEGHEVPDGSEGELVLTTLTRTASPLLRYRTGDWVSKQRIDGKPYLDGGILARTDDMAVIRGVNIYPSAVENIICRYPEVTEFMIEQKRVDNMEEIEVLVELGIGRDQTEVADVLRRLEDRLRDTFCLRIPVRVVGDGTLPRFEFKARRWRKV